MHIIFMLEEPSAEAFLAGFLPRILPAELSWDLIVFQGKSDLLKNLEMRLKAYKCWIPSDWRIVVLVDEDREDCKKLKEKLDYAAIRAGFSTKSSPENGQFQVLNRIVVEELEAWFLGDSKALVSEYPGVSPSFATKTAYRDPDAVKGGTWEALERLLKKAGYYAGGLPKIELAKRMGRRLGLDSNTSASFATFLNGLKMLRNPET